MPGRSIGTMKYEMPGVLADVSASVRGDQDAELRHLGERRPDLLTVDHEHIPVAHGSRAEVGQIGTGVGLGEELAPQLLARAASA